MTPLATIRTHHGSWLASSPDDAGLRATDDPADPDRLVALRLAQRRILLAPRAGSGPGRSALRPAFLSAADPGGRRVITLDDGRLLTATPDGRIETDRHAAGDWERFELVDEPAPVPEGLAPLLEPGLPSSANAEGPDPRRVRDFLDRGAAGRHDPVLDVALIGALDGVLLRELHPTLAERLDYARIFPALQAALSDGQRRSEWHTRAHLGPELPSGWSVGDHTYGNPQIIDGEYGTLEIGRYCSIAGDVRIVVANHATDTLTTYPFAALHRFWPSAPRDARDHVGTGVVIGHSVWIGVGVTVLPGARIGNGAIIGAGAVVAGPVPPYAVAVGNPARVIRTRFDDAVIARLLAIAWWDWPDHEVDRAIPALLSDDVDRLFELADARLAARPAQP